MHYMQLVLFALELALLNSVQSRKICDLTNIECTTLGARNVYKSVVYGVQGVIEPIDPLHMKEIEAHLPSLKYTLFNTTLTGMANCEVTQLIINDKELTYHYGLVCPKLVLNHPYTAKGHLGPIEIDAEGLFIFTLNDYTIEFKGDYSTFISEKDQKLHFLLKKYEVTFESKGKMELYYQGPFHSDKAKSQLAETYLNEHLEDVEDMVRSIPLQKYMAKYVGNVNTYFTILPIEEMFYQH